MIPYDDLVAALSAWRARQGLPVSMLGGAASAPMPVAVSTPGSGPRTAAPTPAATTPGSGPRTAPPRSAPTGRTKPVTVPPPLAAPDEALDVDDAAMLEEAAYEPDGEDFVQGFTGGEPGEPTAIGGAPHRPSDFPTDPGAAHPPKPEDDW